MQITKPSRHDIPALLQLWKEQYDYHFNLDQEYYTHNSPELEKQFSSYLINAIENDDPHILIAKEGEDIIGFTTFEEDTEEYFDTEIKKFGTVIELYVKEANRHQGVGKALMQKAEEYFSSKGLSHIKLASSTFNDDALAFYTSLGYVSRQISLFRKIGEK
ncbi:MAG TPA: GNAT family N-acetyltransferase [Patescibacteria group bacterium]